MSIFDSPDVPEPTKPPTYQETVAKQKILTDEKEKSLLRNAENVNKTGLSQVISRGAGIRLS